VCSFQSQLPFEEIESFKAWLNYFYPFFQDNKKKIKLQINRPNIDLNTKLTKQINLLNKIYLLKNMNNNLFAKK